MTDTAPSKFWFAEKSGTPVKRYVTAGMTKIDLPDSIDPVPVDSLSELASVETDTSVLTQEEIRELGHVEAE